LPTVHIVIRWSGSGGIKAYLGGQLASFSALTLLVGLSNLQKIVPEMTYKVSSGTLSLYSLTHLQPGKPRSSVQQLVKHHNVDYSQRKFQAFLKKDLS